jgi:hypothetical protein
MNTSAYLDRSEFRVPPIALITDRIASRLPILLTEVRQATPSRSRANRDVLGLLAMAVGVPALWAGIVLAWVLASQ